MSLSNKHANEEDAWINIERNIQRFEPRVC